MTIKDRCTVKPIPASECTDWLLHKHYARRLTIIEFSFGLYIDSILSGVCTFGTPFSPPLRKAISVKIYELNRLVVNNGLQKNTLSYFVSRCIQMMPKPCLLVSYADTEMNHHGYIYQATNWIYTGLSAKRTDWKLKGLEHLHGGTIGDISKGEKDRAQYMRDKFGDDFYLKERSRKHRYFYPVGNKKEKKQIISCIPYQIEPYPKGDNQRYDSSYNTTVQLKLI